MESLRKRGGARIGWLNASWPLATLCVDKNNISLDVGFSDKYTFNHNDVVSITKHSIIPYAGWGIRINHNNKNFPEKIIFWCFSNPERLLNDIKAIGFYGTGSPSELIQSREGFPIRWEIIIFGILLWNILLISDFGWGILSGNSDITPGPLSLLAVASICMFSVILLRSDRFQKIVLEPDRSIGEIRGAVRLVCWISGGLTIAFLISSIFWLIEKLS